jgi:hypothetical protein
MSNRQSSAEVDYRENARFNRVICPTNDYISPGISVIVVPKGSERRSVG